LVGIPYPLPARRYPKIFSAPLGKEPVRKVILACSTFDETFDFADRVRDEREVDFIRVVMGITLPGCRPGCRNK
jgi:hypothetical protein